ncbi:hypothetical protein OJ253_3324 [Cryptosporidium canis]|uniref:Uncharacterized protein n=1 Tax=Cryptosporidium canis TaxID=195482 RepID=A0A9D5DJY2_9CRYT|nr:hypothetical protein OJ253_3324 [Cryptosporidium canis]
MWAETVLEPKPVLPMLPAKELERFMGGGGWVPCGGNCFAPWAREDRGVPAPRPTLPGGYETLGELGRVRDVLLGGGGGGSWLCRIPLPVEGRDDAGLIIWGMEGPGWEDEGGGGGGSPEDDGTPGLKTWPWG